MDVYLFRSLGMLLFNHDKVARYFTESIGLMEWPYQPMYNVIDGRLGNIGEKFIIRAPLFGKDQSKVFVYYGVVTLFGLSHSMGEATSVSWGIGPAALVAEPLQVRTSAGLF